MKPVDQMNRQEFVDTFGGIYEHSSWIAQQSWDNGLNTSANTALGLHSIMAAVVMAAPHAAQLQLLCAHPDLAGKLALSGKLTEDSTAEQASAGLDKCTQQEFDELQALNQRYQSTFSFPYILAVKGRKVPEIIENFRSRVKNDGDTEFREALEQVNQIALLRLEGLWE